MVALAGAAGVRAIRFGASQAARIVHKPPNK